MEPQDRYLAKLTHEGIDISGLISWATRADCGALSIFLGTTRDNSGGRAVVTLRYEAYEAMAVRQLEEIAKEVAEARKLGAVAVVHRLGEVPVGEASIAIVCTSPHRDEAMSGARDIIERVKQSVTVWKREVYADGSQEWRAN